MATAAMTDAVDQLRRARRRRTAVRLQGTDLAYRAYLTLLLGSIGLWILAHLPSGRAASPRALAAVLHRGPGVFGLVGAAAVAMAAAAGARGGPLILEAADVHHLLLAPVPSGRTLLRLAVGRVQEWTVGWGVVGAAAGLAASREFPGGMAAWVVAGATWGGLAGALCSGTALVASGRQASRRQASLVGAACLAWAGLDALSGRVLSPFALLARVALLPILPGRWPLLVALPVAGVVAVGLRGVGGMSLEPALRRAALGRQLRFALSRRDLSTAILVGRSLIDERPRRRPWVRTRPAAGRRFAVWKRDWQGVLRWPARRLIRDLGFSVAAGAALRGVLAGGTSLLAVAGVALWLGAVCSETGLAAEVQHADQGRGLPVTGGRLLVRHYPASAVTAALLFAGGALAGSQVGGWSGHALLVAGLTAAPAALAAAAAASISTVRSVLEPVRLFGLPQEVAAAQLLAAEALPPAVATSGLLPVWAVQHYGGSPLQRTIAWAGVPLAVSALVVGWLWLRGLDEVE